MSQRVIKQKMEGEMFSKPQVIEANNEMYILPQGELNE
jgi:hypothetical protein